MLSGHVLSLLIFSPLIFALIVLAIPEGRESFVRGASLIFSMLVFVFSLLIFGAFDSTATGYQFQELMNWIPSLGIHYRLGLDGISLPLIVLTTFLTPIVILASWNAVTERVKPYFFFLLALETGMLGAFVALDTILFYVFWEAMLIPMYFLIGVWGGKDRIYASMKFFLYTLAGSLLMLVAIFYVMNLYKTQFGVYSASVLDLYNVKIPFSPSWFSPQVVLFLAFALAFSIKVPLFPLHTWLPDAHVQAPTAGSVILAGVLLKLGGYGFIRFAFPIFPQAAHFTAPLFMALGTIAIVYGAWVAMVQPDIKKLVAYSSVSHMGYVVIGLFSFNPLAITGALYQMLNHGISTGGLFLIVGMIYERRHTREISEFGGIAKQMPLFAILFMIITLSSVALPGTNGFIGEFLILLGVFQVKPLLAILAGTGVIFGACYMLWMFKRVMFGPITKDENKHLADLSPRELVVLAPIIVMIFFTGIFPNFFLSKMDASIQAFMNQIKV